MSRKDKPDGRQGLLSRKTHPVRYAVGMFGTSIPINMFKTYAPIFYVEHGGLPNTTFALILSIYTFIDAIDNIIYGYLSDRTRTRWGRRRPWLVVGTPLLVLAFVAFYNPPALAPGSREQFMYVLLFYILSGTLDSLINANYGALFPDLFREEKARTQTNAIRQAFQLAAMVISIALTPVVAEKLGYGLTALVYGLLGGGVILYCALGCHESQDIQTLEKPRIWPSILALAKNTHFWIAGVSNAFYSAGMGLVMSALPFYAKYWLKIGGGETSMLYGAVLLVSMGAVGLWAKAIHTHGLLPVWRTALAVLTLAFVPLYFTTTLIATLVAAMGVGVGFAGAIATFDLIGARIIDEDAGRSGLRREGIYSSMGGFLNRLNSLFVALGFILAQTWYGYESGDAPGNTPDQAARFLMVLFPFVLMLISCLVSRFLHFSHDKRSVTGA